ncbi:YjcZ family sporulation protein [Paenibacillus sp. Marseille-Q4541]|nr:YjcZ family sporulation protein [Paenibacillus sp. Marseille-Q4541]
MSEVSGYGYGGGCGGFGGGWTSIGAILVLFILLVIISKTILY